VVITDAPLFYPNCQVVSEPTSRFIPFYQPKQKKRPTLRTARMDLFLSHLFVATEITQDFLLKPLPKLPSLSYILPPKALIVYIWEGLFQLESNAP